jgi:hypothetical protein
MKGNFINPYVSSKSSDNAGVQHGSGLPGKTGLRKGTFTNEYPNKDPLRSSKPPRKMN